MQNFKGDAKYTCTIAKNPSSWNSKACSTLRLPIGLMPLAVDLLTLGQRLAHPRIPKSSGRAVCVAQLAAAQRHVCPAVPGATYIVIFGWR